MEISGLDDYLHLSDAGYLWMVQRMWSSYDYGEIDFLVSTLGQENSLYGSVALWGSDLS